jgi:LPS export ABC transporter protein LptC
LIFLVLTSLKTTKINSSTLSPFLKGGLRGITLAPLLCIFTLASCTNNKEKIKSLSLPPERPAQKSKQVTLLYSDSARLKAILKANEMITYDKNQPEPFIFFPKRIEVIFYDQQQIPTSTLTANQAVYFTKTQKAYLKYDVNFINNKHEHLITENIVWNQSTGKITTDKPIQIITPTQIIKGNGIECEEDFSDYTIKNITGIIQMNDSINANP